jgi:hypothetical protein
MLQPTAVQSTTNTLVRLGPIHTGHPRLFGSTLSPPFRVMARFTRATQAASLLWVARLKRAMTDVGLLCLSEGQLNQEKNNLKIVLDKELTISLYQDRSLQRGPLMTVSLDGGGNGTV